MRAAERADTGEIDLGQLLAAVHLVQHAVLSPYAGLNDALDGYALDGELPSQSVGDGTGGLVVHPDHGGRARAEIGEDLRLDTGIIVERAVTVEMVRSDVEQRRGIECERWREVDLVGG